MHSLPIHSSTFSSSYQYSFLNCSDFMVSLYWSLNLLDSVLNRPTSVLHVSFPAVRISKYCRPFLPNQILTSASLSVCGVLYVERILLTSTQNVFNSLYLSCTFQTNVGCFMVGPPTLGPYPLCILSAQASAIVCRAILMASAPALVIVSLMICSDTMIFVYVFLWFIYQIIIFNSWHHVTKSCLLMMISHDVLLWSVLLWVCDNESARYKCACI